MIPSSPPGALRRLRDSATFTTWTSLGARTLDLAIVLPLVLARFAPSEVALWTLFLSILILQNLVESGFHTTFVRVVAFVLGRRAERPESDPSLRALFTEDSSPAHLAAAWTEIRWIYRRLAAFAVVVLAVLGTLAMAGPISRSSDPGEAWWAWALVATTAPIVLRGNVFPTMLLGMDRVALLRRWETTSLLVVAAVNATVLLGGGGLLELVVARQLWALANVLLNRWLLQGTGALDELPEPTDAGRRRIREVVLPAAWRSSLGVAMATGLLELTGILYAQSGDSAEVASYLVAIKLAYGLQQWSAAPFYSRLPLFARLYAESRRRELVVRARKRMFFSLLSFNLGFVGLGIAGPRLLDLLGSHVEFASPTLWCLLGWAFFVERWGAMHLQLFSTSNRILWHVANGVSGVLYLLLTVALFPHFGVRAIPAGMLLSHLLFYSWYSARLSYRTFPLGFWELERVASLGPLLVMVAYTFFAL